MNEPEAQPAKATALQDELQQLIYGAVTEWASTKTSDLRSATQAVADAIVAAGWRPTGKR